MKFLGSLILTAAIWLAASVSVGQLQEVGIDIQSVGYTAQEIHDGPEQWDITSVTVVADIDCDGFDAEGNPKTVYKARIKWFDGWETVVIDGLPLRRPKYVAINHFQPGGGTTMPFMVSQNQSDPTDQLGPTMVGKVSVYAADIEFDPASGRGRLLKFREIASQHFTVNHVDDPDDWELAELPPDPQAGGQGN